MNRAQHKMNLLAARRHVLPLASSILRERCTSAFSVRRHSSSAAAGGLEYHLMGSVHHRVPGLVTPRASRGGIVVIQEWWGVNDQVKTTALKIAEATGCKVAVPDLYRSKVAHEVAEAQHLLGELDWKKAVEDVKESVSWLKSKGCERVGVLGFCMGGALALGAGASIRNVDASICFYGWNKGLADMSLMPKPTQCHFGSKDDHSGFSDPAAAAELKRLLERSGCTLEFHTYHGLGHGFMNGDTEWGRDMNSRLGRPPISDHTVSEALERVATFAKKHILNPPEQIRLE